MRKFGQALGVAAALVGFQLAVLLILVPSKTQSQLAGDSGGSRFLKLNNWDSFHYSDLVENGYHMPPGEHITSRDVHEYRANLGYFPGYWSAAALVRNLFQLSTYSALLVTAQFFGVVFWIYLFLLFRAGGIGPKQSFGYLCLVAAYPSAFFLVVGYSESMFMASCLGFIFWCDQYSRAERPKQKVFFWALVALHGFVMCATRIVGVPVAAYPIVKWCCGRIKSRRSLLAIDGAAIVALLIMVISLSAAVGFFVYSQLKFGHWDWYFRLQTIGWGKDPNYLALLDPRSYVPHFFFEDTVDSISRAAVPFTLWLLWRDVRPDWDRNRWERMPLYFAAFSLFYIAMAAKADAGMDSMIRYTWPAVALLVLGWAQIQKELRDAALIPKARRIHWGWSLTVVLSVAIQIWSAYRFLRGRWVA